MPKKPRIIIAHVEGSGTAAVMPVVVSTVVSCATVNSISSPSTLKLPKPPHPFPQLVVIVLVVAKVAGATGVALIVVPMPQFVEAPPIPAKTPFRVPSPTALPPVEAPAALSTGPWTRDCEWLLIVKTVGKNTPSPEAPELTEPVAGDALKVNTTVKLSPARLPPPKKLSESVFPVTLATCPV